MPKGVLAAPFWFPDPVPVPSARPCTMGIAYSLPAGVLGSKVTPGSGAAAWAEIGAATANTPSARTRQRLMLLGIDANSRLRACRETPFEPETQSIFTRAWLARPA